MNIKKLLRLLLLSLMVVVPLSAISQIDGTEIPPMCLPCAN